MRLKNLTGRLLSVVLVLAMLSLTVGGSAVDPEDGPIEQAVNEGTPEAQPALPDEAMDIPESGEVMADEQAPGAQTQEEITLQAGGTANSRESLVSAIEAIDGDGQVVLINDDFSIDSTVPVAANYNFTIAGSGRVISRSAGQSGPMFDILGGAAGKTVSFMDITLAGAGDANAALVNIGAGASARIGVGATLNGNTNTAGNGGGVYVAQGGMFTMDGGAIDGNTAKNGGGVYVANAADSEVVISGGSISNNKSSNENGGGIYISDGTVRLSGAAINGNTAGFGGGVYVTNSGLLYMDGANISGNTATSWGGGGGVFVQGGARMYVTGTAPNAGVISGNIASSATGADVCLYDIYGPGMLGLSGLVMIGSGGLGIYDANDGSGGVEQNIYVMGALDYANGARVIVEGLGQTVVPGTTILAKSYGAYTSLTDGDKNAFTYVNKTGEPYGIYLSSADGAAPYDRLILFDLQEAIYQASGGSTVTVPGEGCGVAVPISISERDTTPKAVALTGGDVYRSDAFTGDMLSVPAGSTLSLGDIKIDGKQTTPGSVVKVNGALKLSGKVTVGGGGGIFNANNADSGSLTVSSELTGGAGSIAIEGLADETDGAFVASGGDGYTLKISDRDAFAYLPGGYTVALDNTDNRLVLDAPPQPVWYTVTFKYMDGLTPDTFEEVEAGGKVSKPSAPVREDYTFCGWYTSEDYAVRYNFNRPVTSDFSLYARWIHNSVYVPVERIEITPGKKAVYAGHQVQLTAAVYPENASNKEIEWVIWEGNASKAEVDENGLVTTMKRGRVDVTAKAVDGSGVQAKALVVIKVNAKLVGVPVSPLAVEKGASVYPLVTVQYSDGSTGRPELFTSNQRIARVYNSDGRIWGVRTGEAIVTYTVPDISDVVRKIRVIVG